LEIYTSQGKCPACLLDKDKFDSDKGDRDLKVGILGDKFDRV